MSHDQPSATHGEPRLFRNDEGDLVLTYPDGSTHDACMSGSVLEKAITAFVAEALVSETALLEDVPFDAGEEYTRAADADLAEAARIAEHYDVDSANAAFLIFDDCRQRGQDEREAFMRAIPRLTKATPSATRTKNAAPGQSGEASFARHGSTTAALDKGAPEASNVLGAAPHDKHSTPKAVALRCAEIVREYARRDDIDHDSVPGVTITAIQDFAATLSDTASATRAKDDLAEACAGLINYWTRNLRNFQWEKADEHVKRINIALGEYVPGGPR